MAKRCPYRRSCTPADARSSRAQPPCEPIACDLIEFAEGPIAYHAAELSRKDVPPTYPSTAVGPPPIGCIRHVDPTLKTVTGMATMPT